MFALSNAFCSVSVGRVIAELRGSVRELIFFFQSMQFSDIFVYKEKKKKLCVSSENTMQECAGRGSITIIKSRDLVQPNIRMLYFSVFPDAPQAVPYSSCCFIFLSGPVRSPSPLISVYSVCLH